MMVPAVTEVCLPQWAHSQVHALVCSGQALLARQAGQTKPSGQRTANRYRTQAASSGKRLWNSIRECGNSDMAGPGQADVLFMFYHQPKLSTTANGSPGRTGISRLATMAAVLSGVPIINPERYRPQLRRSDHPQECQAATQPHPDQVKPNSIFSPRV